MRVLICLLAAVAVINAAQTREYLATFEELNFAEEEIDAAKFVDYTNVGGPYDEFVWGNFSA